MTEKERDEKIGVVYLFAVGADRTGQDRTGQGNNEPCTRVSQQVAGPPQTACLQRTEGRLYRARGEERFKLGGVPWQTHVQDGGTIAGRKTRTSSI